MSGRGERYQRWDYLCNFSICTYDSLCGGGVRKRSNNGMGGRGREGFYLSRIIFSLLRVSGSISPRRASLNISSLFLD
jgi:hypothetical protein